MICRGVVLGECRVSLVMIVGVMNCSMVGLMVVVMMLVFVIFFVVVVGFVWLLIVWNLVMI